MIKAEVTYTYEHFKTSQVHVFSKKQLFIWFITLMADTILAILIAVNDKAYFNLFVLFSIIQWSFTFYFTLLHCVVLNPRKLLIKYLESQPSPSVFEFGDDTIKITHASKDAKGIDEHSYDAVEIAYKKDNFFVLQIKRVGRIAFAEAEITEGSPNELSTLLQLKLGNKFEIK